MKGYFVYFGSPDRIHEEIAARKKLDELCIAQASRRVDLERATRALADAEARVAAAVKDLVDFY